MGALLFLCYVVCNVAATEIDEILNIACERGDLGKAYKRAAALSADLSPNSESSHIASTLHIKSCLELVTKGNYSAAVNYHQQAKAADKTVVPPLAALHLAEKTCGGISDIFFVAAVIIKELANEDQAATKPRIMDIAETRPASEKVAKQVFEGFQTLVTLSFDSGLHRETEVLANRAMSMLSEGFNTTTQSYQEKQKLLAFRVRSTLLSPAVFESKKHLQSSRKLLVNRMMTLANDVLASKRQDKVMLARLDEFVVSPTFYFVYQGYKDKMLLSYLHSVYSSAFPDLNDVHVEKTHLSPYMGVKPKKKGSKKKKEKKKEKNEEDQIPLEGTVVMDEDGHSAEEVAEFERLGRIHAQKEDRKEKDRNQRRELEEKRLRTPLRVGFVSAHYRRHSICKLFCGVISGMAHLPTPTGERKLEVLAFSSLQESHEDDTTKEFIAALPGGKNSFIRVGKTVVSNRKEVTSRMVDVLVFLDVGMDPSTMIWASARLAPVQVCLWGHPTTTGLSHMDYFASSSSYHNHEEDAYSAHGMEVFYSDVNGEGSQIDHTNMVSSFAARDRDHMLEGSEATPTPTYDRFSEQLLMFDSLGFHFKKPDHDASAEIDNVGLRALLEGKRKKRTKLILFPQHLPKLHPDMDTIFREILLSVPDSKLVLVFGASKKLQWKRTVERRWTREESLSRAVLDDTDENGESRIVWLDNLKPHEYLALLAAGDLMLDPFPFGGGVTTLESLAVCTPVLTLPDLQTVPALAAGMLQEIGLQSSGLIAHSPEEYIDTATHLLGGEYSEVADELRNLRENICREHDKLYSNQKAVEEWASFMWNLH